MKERKETEPWDPDINPGHLEEKVDFDWKDVIAFSIAIFQVLLPYVLFIFGGVGFVIILFYLIFSK